MSAKRQRFVNAYLGEAAGNATKAAIIAGYSQHTARQAGSRLLTYSDVQEAVQTRRARISEKADVTAARVIQELAVIAFSDIRGLFDEHGHLRPVHELPDDVARALASVEVSKERTTKGADTVTDEWLTKVKTWDKTKALDMLGKHLAMWHDRSDGESSRITVNIGFLDATLPTVIVSHGTSQVMASPACVALPENASE